MTPVKMTDESQKLASVMQTLRIMAEKASQVSNNKTVSSALQWRALGQAEALRIAAWIIEFINKEVGAPNLTAGDMSHSYVKMLEMAETLAKSSEKDDEIRKLEQKLREYESDVAQQKAYEE